MGKRIENWKCGAGMNVLRLSNISPAARLLYAILYGYKSKGSPHPFPSEETLAKDLGCKKRTVSRLKGDLKRAELITWQSKPGGSNVYTIFDSPIDTAVKDSRATDDQGCIVTSDTGVLSPVTTEWKPANGNHMNRNHMNGNHASYPKKEEQPRFYKLNGKTYSGQQISEIIRISEPEEIRAIMQQLFPSKTLSPGSIDSVGALIS